MDPIPFNAEAWTAMGESMLIGLLVGIDREADREERHAGLRDFVTIGLAGGLCGLLGQTWLTAAALLALTTMIVAFRLQTPGRTGITTELVAVATFLLCVLTGTSALPWGSPLAIAVTVVLALFLDARERLKCFFVEVITRLEFFDTLRFLAVIFVVYPVLPDANLGPYGFFNPRQVWLFVILVCSLSWLGYFLQKFLGGRRGLWLTSVLGGIASTTAATSSFARQCTEEPERRAELVQAALLANAVQFPRILALVALAGAPALVRAALPEIGAMTLMGLAAAWWANREGSRGAGGEVKVGNPFHLTPALKFGALFAAVRLLARAASAEFGARGVLWASAVGGLIDVDAIAFSISGLLRHGQLDAGYGAFGLWLALTANGVFKTVLAYNGGRRFGRGVLLGFACMFGAGGLALLLPALL